MQVKKGLKKGLNTVTKKKYLYKKSIITVRVPKTRHIVPK